MRRRTVSCPIAGAIVSLLLGVFGCQGDGGPIGGASTCASKRDCAGDEVCVAGSCRASAARPCTTDETCPLGQLCDQSLGTCVTPVVGPMPEPGAPRCVLDADCQAGERCDVATGACVKASPAEPCADDSACDAPSTVCVEGRCVAGCGAASDALACGPGTSCNATTGRCREVANACTRDVDCGAPVGVCESRQCLPGCGELGGIACETGSACDPSTGRCLPVAGACSSDAQCNRPSAVCERGQCVPGCGRAGGLECSGATQCNPQSGRCEAGGDFCQSDRDCDAPDEICTVSTGVCAPGCATTGCASGEVCDANGHCVAPRPCASDNYEENDAASAARTVSPGSIPALFSCPADDDWYAVTLSVGDELRVTLSFSAAEGNVDLQLLDPSGASVASATTSGSGESLTHVARVSGVHKFRAYLASDAGPTRGAAYTMNVARAAAPCGQDPYEDNDSRVGAMPIVAGSLLGVNVCVADDDYYALALRPGDRVEVSITFMHGEGDIDLELLDSGGSVVAQSKSTANNETFVHTVQSGGNYVARVYLYNDTGMVAGNGYSMDVNITPAPMPMPRVCTPDWLEENDTSSAAAKVSVGALTGLTLCSGDEDYYQLDLGQGDRLDVRASVATAEGDMSLELLDGSGTVLTRSSGSSGTPSLQHTAAQAGAVTIRPVLGQDRGAMPGTNYDLNISARTANGCTIDGWEPNDTLTTARSTTLRSLSNLAVCTGNDDYYSVQLSAGDNFVATATFATSDGDIDIALHGPSGVEVASASGISGTERISYAVPTTGTYTVRVLLYRDDGLGVGASYSLSLAR